MMTQKKETRAYKFYNKFGKEEYMYVPYDLVFKDGFLERVYNSAHGDWGHAVEHNSECFQFFNEKYNSVC